MITTKITWKDGQTLERELPTDIHQIYHDMREAGISKPPKNILRHDDIIAAAMLVSSAGCHAQQAQTARSEPEPAPQALVLNVASPTDIARELKLSQSTVRRALQDLRKAELLETKQRYRSKGGKTSLLFCLKKNM